MITAKAALSSGALATRMAEKGLTIAALPNTVLSELVKLSSLGVELVAASLPVNVDGSDGDNLIETFASVLENATAGSLDAPHPHSVYADKVIVDVAAAVKQHLGYAKNVVRPVVLEFAEGVKTALEAAKPRTAIEDFDIVVLNMPDLLGNPSFQDDLKYYVDKNPLSPETLIELGPKTRQEIFETIRTGDQEMDEQIVAWYSNLTDEGLMVLWGSLFTKGWETDYILKSPETMFREIDGSGLATQIDAGILLFLLGQRLFNAPGEVKDISLERYQNAMAQLRDYGGAMIMRSLARMTAFETIKQVVVFFNPDQKGCVVYGPTYREWLGSGGSPEILLGMLISGKQEAFYGPLLERREDFLNAWLQYTAFFDTKAANDTFSTFKLVLMNQFSASLGNVSEDEAAFITDHPEFSETVQKLFNEELGKVVTGDMNDLYGLAMRLVCRARFYYTEAEMILSDIEQAIKINPELSVREAALVATIKYVNRYISAQMATNTNAGTNTMASITTLANAAELSARIVKEIAGNDVADSLNGNRLSFDMAYTIAQQDFAAALTKN